MKDCNSRNLGKGFFVVIIVTTSEYLDGNLNKTCNITSSSSSNHPIECKESFLEFINYRYFVIDFVPLEA